VVVPTLGGLISPVCVLIEEYTAALEVPKILDGREEVPNVVGFLGGDRCEGLRILPSLVVLARVRVIREEDDKRASR